MFTDPASRRQWLASAAAVLGAGLAAAAEPAPQSAPSSKEEPFGYCLNTSTIDGQKLTLAEKIEVTVKAGYNGLEPWVREMEAHVKAGGNLKDVGKRLTDDGVKVESAIGFFEWVVDDDERRRKALEDAKHAMDLVQQIGGKRIAAPPFGATNQTDLSLPRAAERYRALLEVGDKIGVVPEVELWGFSKALSRLSEVAYVAIESGHPRACILLDVYHIYKGGSDFHGLAYLNGAALPVLHFNDYPATPPRASIADAQRVYPGDGVAPLKEILRTLHRIGFRGMLSLELFNRDYWNQDALVVARTGLEKMRTAVRESLKAD
jgi:sugar phosphate isomerase/epimerase